jgi:hypothetical protein
MDPEGWGGIGIMPDPAPDEDIMPSNAWPPASALFPAALQ